jgi:hypothetical protein
MKYVVSLEIVIFGGGRFTLVAGSTAGSVANRRTAQRSADTVPA